MPECHKCPHNGKRRAICKVCLGPSDLPNNHGQTFVSVEKVAAFIAAPEPLEDTDPRFDTAIHLLKAFWGLGMIEREIVSARMRGEHYSVIAARLNLTLTRRLTIQAVHARVKKAVRHFPVLEQLFKATVFKQKQRKKKGHV